MKAKKLNKKLVLNKKTISHLGDWEMNKVQGGKTQIPYDTCPLTCEPSCGISCRTVCYSICYCH